MTVLLLSRGRVTAKEMAERFEVSVRTIYRDIEAMTVAGIPIVSFQGAGGGYGLLPNFTLDRQLLSFDGMLSILTALSGIQASLDDTALRDAIEKFRALLPEDKREEAESHLSEFVVDLSPWGMPERHKQRLSVVQQALSNRCVLSFDYQGAGAERMQRSVEPTTLVFKGHAWYLYAYCRTRQDYRLFKISRMRDPVVRDERYTRRARPYRNVELETRPRRDDGPQSDDPRPLTRFVLRFAPRMRSLVEESFDPDDLELDDAGYIIATFEMPEDHWVYGMILSYGTAVEVLEPSRARRIIGETARAIAGTYVRDAG